MRAIEVNRRGGPEVLSLAERDAPQPGLGQVVVQVAAARPTLAYYVADPEDLRWRAGEVFG
jgi:hypothetical protein